MRMTLPSKGRHQLLKSSVEDLPWIPLSNFFCCIIHCMVISLTEFQLLSCLCPIGWQTFQMKLPTVCLNVNLLTNTTATDNEGKLQSMDSDVHCKVYSGYSPALIRIRKTLSLPYQSPLDFKSCSQSRHFIQTHATKIQKSKCRGWAAPVRISPLPLIKGFC